MRKSSWPSSIGCGGAAAPKRDDRAGCQHHHPRGLGAKGARSFGRVRPSGFLFYAPDRAFAEASRYLPDLLKKKGIADSDGATALAYIGTLVEPVEIETYGTFEVEARRRLFGRDEDDWPVLATALALGCPIWTEDADFFGTGVAVWTTNRVEIFLQSSTRVEP